MTLSDTDLHHVIKRGNILKDIHRRYIMYQLLRATRYLHSGNVIHRDQKVSIAGGGGGVASAARVKSNRDRISALERVDQRGVQD